MRNHSASKRKLQVYRTREKHWFAKNSRWFAKRTPVQYQTFARYPWSPREIHLFVEQGWLLAVLSCVILGWTAAARILLFIRIENPEGASAVFFIEKNLSAVALKRATCIQIRRHISRTVYLCATRGVVSSLLPSTSRRPFSLSLLIISSQNQPPRRMLPRPDALRSRGCIHTSRRKSFLPDFAYSFNFDICRSQFRSGFSASGASRNVVSSSRCLSLSLSLSFSLPFSASTFFSITLAHEFWCI